MSGRVLGGALVTAGLIAAYAVRFGAGAMLVPVTIFCAALVAIAVVDLERRVVPNRIVLPAAAAVLAARTALDPSVEWALAATAAAAFLLAAVLAYPGGMGMGDVKLAFLLGAMLGRTVVAALGVGLLAALPAALAVLVRHGRAGRKMAIPFAPFLALGGIAALFAGDELLDALGY